MSDIESLNNDEIRELVISSLKEVGVDPDIVSISIVNGPRVILRGEADSQREVNLIIQTITDVVGIEDITNDIDIIDSGLEGTDGESREEEFYDEDNECIGTEDAFRAVEDGLPYIPPTTSHFDEYDEHEKKKTRREGRS